MGFDYDYWDFAQKFNQLCEDNEVPCRMVMREYTFSELHQKKMTRKITLKERFKIMYKVLFATIYLRDGVNF